MESKYESIGKGKGKTKKQEGDRKNEFGKERSRNVTYWPGESRQRKREKSKEVGS